MNPQNQAKLRRKIGAAGSAAVAKNGYVTAIDALLATGWLRPSETVYVSWTRDRRPLRFSKSGNPNIERAYRTHWLPPKPEADANRRDR